MWSPVPFGLVCLASSLFVAGCETMRGDGHGGGAALEEGFTAIFGGEDLDGWVQILDSEWQVEDGILVARQNPAGRLEGESWLLTERDYGDFELRLEFRITPGGNSGVFLRDPLSRRQRLAVADGGKPPWDAGYEVNINNDEPNFPTGSVWAIAAGAHKLQKEGEWNSLRARLVGQRLWIWVNGTVALDGIELPARSERGAIGFQRPRRRGLPRQAYRVPQRPHPRARRVAGNRVGSRTLP